MANQYSTTLIERFEEKYIPEPNSGCWLWTGSCDQAGYGLLAFRRKTWKAHRVSWVIFHGEIPDGMKVCHRCDVRCCVNPGHFFLGSQLDNVLDMVAKGRNRSIPLPGEANPQAVLNDESVWAIRWLLELRKFSQAEVARSYGVSPMTISRIANNQTWSHVEW